jgi:hypothetical protein
VVVVVVGWWGEVFFFSVQGCVGDGLNQSVCGGWCCYQDQTEKGLIKRCFLIQATATKKTHAGTSDKLIRGRSSGVMMVFGFLVFKACFVTVQTIMRFSIKR